MVRYCCPLTIALSSCDSPAAQFNLCLSQICLLLVLEAASIPKALCSSRRQISSLSDKMTMSYRSWPNSVLMSAELWVLLSSSLPSLIFQTPTIWALASYTALIHALLWPCPAFQQACSNHQQACVPCSRCKSLTVCFVPPNVKQQLIITGSCGSKVFGRGTQQRRCDKFWKMGTYNTAQQSVGTWIFSLQLKRCQSHPSFMQTSSTAIEETVQVM